MTQPFRQLPPLASVKPEAFTVSIPDSTLEEFQLLLKTSKIGPATFENSKSDGKYGISREWLKDAKEQWLKFDW
jgi:microsomal epoxide hydrolase